MCHRPSEKGSPPGSQIESKNMSSSAPPEAKQEVKISESKLEKVAADELAESMMPAHFLECNALELLDAFVMSGKENKLCFLSGF